MEAKIQKAINSWLSGNGNELLMREFNALEKLWRELSTKENDYRSGDKTYGYRNKEEIKNTMEYISDRWMCAFRVKWIIDGLRKGKI